MTWKKAAVVALVVLLVLIGAPILMPGMGGATCSDCGPAVAAGALCALAAVLAGVVVAIALLARRFRVQGADRFELLRAVFFDRPPQVA